MNKQFSLKKSIILTAIILAQVIMLFFIFSKCKQGFHSDEVWSYGFANSVESKELDIANDGTSLMNRWRDSEDFRRYITVEEDQRFRYDAVLYNTNNDYNPPLQLLILHTICSFFPGKFSWYFWAEYLCLYRFPDLYLPPGKTNDRK